MFVSVQSLYDFGFVVRLGWTPGKRLLALRITALDGKRPSPPAALVRPVILFGVWVVPFIGQILVPVLFIAAFADRHGRTPWDLLSKTRVVLARAELSTPQTLARMADAIANDPNIAPPRH
jgi:uncharacterized RDD family membrane protein YckC